MRTTVPLWNKYKVRKVNFPVYWFREQFPMKLRNGVSNNSRISTGNTCVEELGIFVGCLKKHEFDDLMCDREFTRYTTCVETNQAATQAIKAQAKEGLLGSEGRVLTTAQVNNLFKMYPQPDVLSQRSNLRPPWMSYAYPNFIERGKCNKMNRSDRDSPRVQPKVNQQTQSKDDLLNF